MWADFHRDASGRGRRRKIQHAGAGGIDHRTVLLGSAILPPARLSSHAGGAGAGCAQWDQIEKVGDCSYVVFEYLERLAAQGEIIYQDDTSVRILLLMGENRKARAEAEAMGLSR